MALVKMAAVTYITFTYDYKLKIFRKLWKHYLRKRTQAPEKTAHLKYFFKIDQFMILF